MRVFGEDVVVVGVVGDVVHNGLTGPVKERFYRPHAQINSVGTQRSLTLTVGTEGEPRTLVGAMREAVRSMDPTLPLAQVQTMDEVLSRSVARPRFAVVLLGAFAAIALTLAVVGIYGVLSYTASRRIREIGIRMALGAEGGQVVGLLVAKGMVMAAAGIAAGTLAALVLSRLMEGLLYGVEPQDPATFTVVPLLFAAVALLACWVPAARAARVDPMDALRHE